MSTLSKLQKQARSAKKFILATWNIESSSYIFVADRSKTGQHEMTENISNALMFSYGFDDEAIKEKAWSISLGREFMAVAL